MTQNSTLSAELKQQIKQREEQAKERNITGKLYDVARYLGSHTSLEKNEGHFRTEGNRYTFSEKSLSIETEFGSVSGSDGPAGFSSDKIHFRGREVYSSGGGQLYSYIPGIWERTLNRLHKSALVKQEELGAQANAERATQKAKAESAEREKWGL